METNTKISQPDGPYHSPDGAGWLLPYGFKLIGICGFVITLIGLFIIRTTAGESFINTGKPVLKIIIAAGLLLSCFCILFSKEKAENAQAVKRRKHSFFIAILCTAIFGVIKLLWSAEDQANNSLVTTLVSNFVLWYLLNFYITLHPGKWQQRKSM